MNRPAPLRSDISEGFEHLISGYIEERDREAWALFRMVAEERFDEILDIAHNLKGSGGSHGLPELTELGSQLENAAIARDRPAAESVVMQLNAFVKAASVTPQARPGPSEPLCDGWLASRILVIDDSPAMLAMTATMLRMDGHQVHVASSAEQGIESLRKWRPDVMLVDLRLPGANGLEFTRQVRKDAATKDAIVLAMTALSGPDIEKTAAEAGFDGFISKPFDIDRLTTFVRWNLQRRPKTPPGVAGASAHEPGTWDRAFLKEACAGCRALVSNFDSGFQPAEVSRMLLQWAGEAGRYGFDSIPPLARRAAGLLEGLWWDAPYLKESLDRLLAALDALESGPVTAPAPTPSQPVTLIVDDDPSIRRMTQVILEKLGTCCIVAADGEEARQILALCQPRAAIVDVNLPGMNGFEVMEMIRTKAPAARVMLLTGHSTEDQIRHGLAMGAADYVTKPFNPIELASRLKRLLS